MMRYLIFVVIILTGCSSKVDQRLIDFNNKLGSNKAVVLDEISNSFDDYLVNLYPDKADFNERFCYLLSDITSNDYQLDETFIISDTIALKIVDDYINSTLINELMIKVSNSVSTDQKTEYEMDVIKKEDLLIESYNDTSAQADLYDFNLYGDYHQALAQIDNDDFISKYVKAREAKGDMTLPILVPTFMGYCDKIDFNDSVIKRIFAMEIYMQIVYFSLD